MKLVYQTSEIARARLIMEVLSEAGIESTLQGTHTWGLNVQRSVTPLSVWLTQDSEEQKAHQVLERFYLTEAPARKLSVPTSQSSFNKQLVMFLSALAVGVALAALIYGS